MVFALFPGVCRAREPALDPGTGRIRVIYLGDAWGGGSPYQHMILDPKLYVTPVPASSGHAGGMPNISRYIRIYVPRTYNRLVESQDVIILSDTVKTYYQIYHIKWFGDAVIEGGRGLVMVGGREIVDGEWWDSPVEKALPVEWIPLETFEGTPFRAIPTEPPNDFLRSLPWETMPPYRGMNLATPKQGSRVLLQVEGEGYPVLVFWETGKGASVAHTPDWTPAWGVAIFTEWDYYADFIAHILYLAAGADIPEDVDLMHEIREEFYLYTIQWGIITGMIEFVDRFGANIRPLEEELRDVDDMKREASRLYIEQEYTDVLDLVREARLRIDDALDMAQEIKDKALLWIYITEATAVTGTLMISGIVIWALMIKRRLYREVRTTRSL
jgi:uncharacterized membrane protein